MSALSGFTSTTQNKSNSQFLTQLLLFIVSVLTGFRFYSHQLKQQNTLKASDTAQAIITSSSEKKAITHRTIPPITSTPFFGERPHYFMPPSDMEQVRKRSKHDNDSNNQHYIPYPNDPPHTFPSIKARSIFTKSPKKLSQVYIERIDPVNRTNLKTGAKLKVPLQQLEERFRTVYTNARDNGLEITINSRHRDEKSFEKLGYAKKEQDYDFHNIDGLISPPLYRLD